MKKKPPETAVDADSGVHLQTREEYAWITALIKASAYHLVAQKDPNKISLALLFSMLSIYATHKTTHRKTQSHS